MSPNNYDFKKVQGNFSVVGQVAAGQVMLNNLKKKSARRLTGSAPGEEAAKENYQA